MINYSDRALGTRPRFYTPYNDVTIIVEDTSLETFYTELFTCLIGDTIRIERVLGVGGKRNVLDRFHRHRDSIAGQQEFYIVDGDFDELLGRPEPNADRFHRLRRYDIESFLIESRAIARIAQEQNPDENSEYYIKRFNIDEWLDPLVPAVKRLVACLALLNSLSIPLDSQASIFRFVSGNSDLPDAHVIGQFISSKRAEQRKLTDEEFDRALRNILERMGNSRSEVIRWVSGKKILLPLLVRMIRRETRRNIGIDSLRFRLATHCRLRCLKQLKKQVLDCNQRQV